MTVSTHPVEQEEVMALADRELTPGRARIVSSHLAECEACAEVAANLHEASAALGRWTVESIPEQIEKQVLGERREEGSGRARSGIGKPKWVWAGALAGVGLVVLLLVGRGSVRAPIGARTVRPEPMPMAPQAVESMNLSLSTEVAKSKKEYKQAEENYKNWLQRQQESQLTTSLERERPVDGRQADSLMPLSEPNVATDSNGGGGGQVSSSVDGQPTSDQQSKTDSNGALAPMIARTVSLSIVVKDFPASRATLDAILSRHHGYSAQLDVNTAENAARTLQASLRIPAPELAGAINDLKSLGRVENETQGGEEVSQQHADLVARLKNSRETERRLQAILTERTGKISDVLAVEQEIARVRLEIEQMEAEQKSLEHRVDFATVNLNLSEEYKANLTLPMSVGTRLHNGLVEGYRNASETILGIILFFVEYALTMAIWILILLAPAIFLWRRFRRAMATV
jgi:anti-sigma factor RsiW